MDGSQARVATKLLFLCALFFLTNGDAFCHVLPTSADFLKIGTVDPARLDADSVTLRGPHPIAIQDESVPLGNVYTINCVNGANCTRTSETGKLSVIKDANPVALATFTFTLQGAGTVLPEIDALARALG